MSDLDYAASWDKPENEEDNVGLDYASRWKKEDDRDLVIQRKIQEQRVWRRDPKRAAEALTLANERGIPASVMYDKLEEFKRPQVDYEKMQRNAPILFGLMGNTAYTPILQSDVENMSGFEAGWNELQKRIAETSETDEMGLLGEKWSNDSATEADIKRIEEIRNLQSSRPDYELGWANPFYYAGVTAGVGLDLGLSGARALPVAGAGAAGGAVTGAGAGAALGTFTIPFVGTATGAGGGAVLGGVAGFGAGLRAGFAVDSYKKQKGLTFIELMYSFNENGDPFDRDTAKAISTSVGAINAALDVVGVEFVAKAFPGVKDMLGGKLIQTVTTNPAARNALVKMYRIAQAGLGEGTTELLQSITELETTLQAGAVFDSEGGQRAEQRSQYPTAFGEGFVGAAGLATVGQGAQSIVDARKARAEAARQRLIDLGDKIRESKVPSLSPETMSEFARSLDDSNPSQMTAPVDSVVKLFQEEGFTPEQIEQRFPGLTASLDEAQQGNAEVKLKAADVVKMAQLKGYDEFTSDIRIGEAPTAKEAARLNEEGDSLIADVGAEEQRQAVQASIENEITQQLTAAGQEQRAAQTQAKLFTSTLTNLAQRAGLDVNELYNRYNLSIRGEQDGQGLEGVKLDQATRDVLARTPELQEGFRRLSAGEITQEQFSTLVDQYKPVRPYTEVPRPATTEEMFNALTSNKRDKIGKLAEYKEGYPVALRLDIPAYSQKGVWVPTIHDQKTFKTISHEAAAHISGATFSIDQGKAGKVVAGGPKSPFATIDGSLLKTSVEDIQRLAEQAINDPAWTQVGMDPERHSYFYDRKTMRPVVKADEVIQVGPLVLAKNATFGEAQNFLFQTASLRRGTETLKKYGLKPGKKYTTREVATALEARQRKKYGIIDEKDTSETAAKKIASWMVEEVLFEVDAAEINPEKSAVGWYSTKFQRALDVLGAAFPEFLDDKGDGALPGITILKNKENARAFFTALMAVTSDGAKVADNFRFAAQAYENFRQTGKINADVTFGGERNASMRINLANIQNALDSYGPDEMSKVLLKKDTISNLKKLAKAEGAEFSSAYKANMELPYAALIFGPKLGAFYANLMGDTGYLTMDRWWSRTFNRYRGTLLQKPTTAGLARFKELVTVDRRLNEPPSEMADDQALALTVDYVRSYKEKGYKNGTEIEKAANTLYKAAFEGLEDQPFNASDREFMINTTLRAQKMLARKGIDLTIADIQAVLWYYEKRLYGQLGARQTQDISYEEIARKVIETRNGNTGRPADGLAGEAGDAGALDAVSAGEGTTDVATDAVEEDFNEVTDDDGTTLYQGVEPERTGDGGGRYSSGSLTPLAGAPQVRDASGPDPSLVAAAEQYARDNGIPLRRQAEYVQVDEDRARRIAEAYEAMPHAPQDPAVREAYQDLIRQTMAQYRALEAAGYKFWFIDINSEAGQDYASTPWNAMRDLRANKSMGVFPTDAGFGTKEDFNPEANPLLEDTGLQWPFGGPDGEVRTVYANDLFRAVHDAFGHGLEGSGFRAQGEENAWQAHVRLFTGPAVGALTSETRGQNSWLNYGPNGESNRTAKVEDTVFADQKTGLMPPWTWEEGRAADEAPETGPSSSQTLYQNAVDAIANADLITNTPEFRRWFGNSVVVDPDGKPLIVFHGSENAGFTVFNTDGGSAKTKGTGAFFSNKLSNAMTYSGDRRLVDLSGGEAPAQQGNVPVFLKIEKPLVIDAQGQNWSNIDGRTTDEIIRDARASGEYDGVIFRNLVDEGQYGWYDDASDVYVTFEPSQIKSVQNQGTFEPANPNILKQKARGFITFTDARNKFEITLTGKANLSTFVHESAHFFLEVMQDLVARGEAPQQLVQDLSIIKSWMGIAPEKKAGPAGKIEVKHHEKFARAFEAYLREGRAPDNALQDIFNRFRAWLVFIYKKMRALDVELTDEVRGVFDRLVASDVAIAEARTQLGWSRPMPQEALALTDEEYARYVETWQKASDEQSRELDERMMREAADARKDSWKQETERRVGEEIAALKKTRGYKAWKALTDGEGLEDIGRTALKIDPESVPSEWRRDTVGMTEEGGMPLEVVAELLGFQSGEAMLQLIGGAKVALRDIPIKVKKAMEAEHGHLDATALADAASEAVIKPVGEVLLSEYRALAASAGIRVEPGLSQWMAATAKRKVQALTQRQLEPSRWRRAELKSARESAAAAARGDKQKAALAKRQQMMAAAMYRATIDAQKRIDTIQSKLTPFTKDKRRAQLGKAGDTYLDAIDEILEGISFKNVTAKSLEKQNRLATFLKEAEEKDLPVNIPDYLTAALGKRNYSTMTLEELEGVHDTVMSIWHLAKTKNELRANKEKRDIENFLAEMAVNAERAMGAAEVDKDFVKGIRQRANDGLRFARSQLTKLEFVFGWLDGTPAGGLTHRFIYQPLVDANFEKFKILKRYQKTLVERLRKLPAAQRTRWNTKRMFMGGQADGATIIAAALNLGNEANKQKLLDGYGWDEARLMAEINAFMKKEDWDLVQHIWDEIDTLWPKIVEVTKAATGLAPERVEALPVQTPFGQYRGGYYPVVYDPSRTERVFQNQQKTEGLFSNNYLKPKLGDGFTKGRTNYSAPILLDLGVIPRHLAQVVHYVTHYEAIDQINRITSNPRFEEIVSGHMGKDFYRLLKPWLQDIAKDQDTPAITKQLYVSRVLQYLRGGISITAMGFNLVTGFKQLYGVTTALDAIPLRFWASGVVKAWFSPSAFSNWKEALDKSKELRPLIEQVDRDIYMMNRMYAQNIASRARDAAVRYAFAHIGYFQLAVNVATWHGAFEQAISEGKPEADAINIADAIVRQTQSAGAVKDLSALQRGTEAERMVTMFYSWFNVLYNRLEDIARTTGSIRDVPRAAKRLAILVFYSAILEETIGRGWEALMGEDEEDDEDVGYILSVLYRGLDQLVVAIPGVSFFVRGETTPPAFTVVRDAERALKAAEKIVVEQEMLTQAEGRAIARFVSTTFQIPAKGIYDLLADVYDMTTDDTK